ncbi:glycosyltransferase family 4 protein [Patescibacteria group bacterium]|nr:glycosyltransferase family 4 protein [Patescibacteria group bacterium]
MKKLRIAQISPLRFSVPAEKRGGNEMIISYLTEELVKRGHKVTLFASGDSKTKAKLVSLLKKPLNCLYFTESNYWWNIFSHSFAIEKASDFDIIHCHWDIMGAFFQRFVKAPVLNTAHYIMSPRKSVQDIFEYYKNDLNIVFIRDEQRDNSPIKFKNSWVVYNGIDVSKFKFSEKGKDHLVWAGRLVPGKDVKEMIKVAKKSGEKLFLAGQIEEHSREYFKKEIKPHLGSRIKYVGELSQKELSDFYGSAKACLYPAGLVTLESMACGTPVISPVRKKMIMENKTGFVVKDTAEAVRAIKKIGEINRHDCRKWVEDNFSVEKMVDEYEKIYYEMLKRKKR